MTTKLGLVAKANGNTVEIAYHTGNTEGVIVGPVYYLSRRDAGALALEIHQALRDIADRTKLTNAMRSDQV